MHITLRVARGIKSFIQMVYVKLLIYYWPFPDILWWVCGQCYANPLIRWPDSSFLCVLSTNQHMSLPDCFVLCVCSHLYMTAHVYVCVFCVCVRLNVWARTACHCLLLNDYICSHKHKLASFSSRCRDTVTRPGVATNLPPQTLRKREMLMNKRAGRQIKSTGTPPKSHRILVHTAQAFTWIKHGRVSVWKWEMLIFIGSIVGSVISLSNWH